MLKIAAICGPTASGKTALAVRLRRDFGLPVEMLSVDALQVYQQLDAGTAKPTPEERQQIPTHLVDIVAPQDAMNAAIWVAHAERAIQDVHARGAWPLLVGGTGLYLRALLRGLAAIPDVPPDVREALASEYATRGADALWAELRAVDPDYAALTPPQNRQRLLRALEVWRHTGQPFSAYHAAHRAQPDHFACLRISLEPPRDQLLARIRERALAMAEPLWHEVEALRAAGLSADAPGLQAIGYRDAWLALQNHQPVQFFAERLVAAHQAYAKKQATWFRNNPAELRVTTAEPAEIAAVLRQWFASP
jgi:tRNA dimethylallyltransferase